jgi:RND family efflux transporter MFP subunit
VTLTEAAAEMAALEIEPALTAPLSEATAPLELPGRVEADRRRVALISPRTSGRIERLGVVEGDRVEAGQAVAWLQSAAFVTAQADFLQANRRAAALAGTADAEGARAMAEAARRRLLLLGASGAVLARLEAGGPEEDFLPVLAPFAGSIVRTAVLSGAAVDAGSPLFELADLSAVNVVAEVPESALPSVRVGQPAEVRITAYPELRFSGRVERLREELNPDTRTVPAVINVPNRRRVLRPGMFATVSLLPAPTRPTGPARDVVVVPESAVLVEGVERVVFVEVGPRTYERRTIRVVPLSPPGATHPRLAVTDGLRAGERVVVRGAFTLKSELGKAGFGEEE